MEDLEAGMIGVNTSSYLLPIVTRDNDANFGKGAISGADSPFGGIKESGYGKEAGKDIAVDEYLITKAISLALEARL